jgi:preprotein translocase subunit YajC
VNWIKGTQYKTRGGQVATIVRANETLVEVEFADNAHVILTAGGTHLVDRQLDLVSLVGPTQYVPAPDGKSCA